METAQQPFIQIQRVSKTYRRGHERIPALHEVSANIGRGELLAVVGPSGAGKTTFVQILGGLMTPDTGRVVVGGYTVGRGSSDRALSRYRGAAVGFVFQNFSLLPHYTALENVMVPLIIAGVGRRKRRALARQYLELVGLEKRLNSRADQLSGGEQQRVSIARALVRQPQLIIADEPTGSLDTAHGQEIMAILERLSHERHITVVMVTHDEALAARADRVLHIRDGKLKEAPA